MDLTSLLGPVVALGAILGGMLVEGGHMSSVLQFTAFLIVFGGAFGAILVAYPLPDVIFAFKCLGTWLKNPNRERFLWSCMERLAPENRIFWKGPTSGSSNATPKAALFL